MGEAHTAAAIDNGRAVSASFQISRNLYFTALVPDFTLSTRQSRSVLPDKVAREDAIFNISRCSLLIKAFETGDRALFFTALQDRLHQNYRLGLINGFERAQHIAKSFGAYGVCISGAGPTLLCICGDEHFSEKIKTPMSEFFPKWRVLPLIPDLEGAVCLPDGYFSMARL